MSVIDEIKARLDIVDYVGRYVPLKKSGRYFKTACPFHAENTPSFVVSAERQSWTCFGACATGGDVIAFAMRKHGWTFPEALRELGALVGVEVKPPSPSQKEQEAQRDMLRILLAQAADAYHNCLMRWPGAAMELGYLRDTRRLSWQTIEQFRLGYAPGQDWDRLTRYLLSKGYSEDDILAAGVARRNDQGHLYDLMRNRIIVPIRDTRGRVIALAGRAVSEGQEPKYLNTPATVLFDKSRTLFGLTKERTGGTAVNAKRDVVIVEGYMDVIQAHQAGFVNVVAQMGTALNPHQVDLLKGYDRIIVALDGDEAGFAATQRNLEVLSKSARDIRVIRLSANQDPDDVLRESPDLWQSMVDNAVTLADYIIDQEVSNLPANASVVERLDSAKRLIPILMAVENNIYRMDNIQKLALALRLNERELMSLASIPAAVPASPVADIRILPAPSKVDPLESYLLAGYLLRASIYYDVAVTFIEMDLDGPSVEDFTDADYREIMRVLLEALNQNECPEEVYFLEHLDRSLTATVERISADWVDDPYTRPVDTALRLRRRRLESELDALAETDSSEGVQPRRKARARIMVRFMGL